MSQIVMTSQLCPSLQHPGQPTSYLSTALKAQAIMSLPLLKHLAWNKAVTVLVLFQLGYHFLALLLVSHCTQQRNASVQMKLSLLDPGTEYKEQAM